MWLALAVINAVLQTTCSGLFGRHLNPEMYMTTREIIQFWGYPIEEYEVLTDDGYFLHVERIPYGLQSPQKKEHKPPVLLVGGLFCLTHWWVPNPPRSSIGFVLADAGYDVWMLNVRGTSVSKKHMNLCIEQEEFWDFSFHEMGIYDIPAVMEFIFTKTKHEQLYFIGHSQGGSLGLVTFSVFPELSKKVKLLMLLAPSYTLAGTTTPGVLLLKFPDAIKWLVLGRKMFENMPRNMKRLGGHMCSFPIIDRLCRLVLAIGAGYNVKNKNLTRMDVYTGFFLDTTSVKTVIHWGQVAISGEFKYFDYGNKNKDVYNMTTPPFYKLEAVTAPTALWSAGADIMADLEDIELLIPRLTHLVFYKHISDWCHADFVLGLDAPQKLYPDMLWLMEQYK